MRPKYASAGHKVSASCAAQASEALFHAIFTQTIDIPWIFYLYTTFTQVLISRLSFLWFRSLLLMMITMVFILALRIFTIHTFLTIIT